MSVDPLADSPDNSSYSPYSYVANNPLRYTDPTGMTREDNGMGLFDNGMGLKLGGIIKPYIDLGSKDIETDLFHFFKDTQKYSNEYFGNYDDNFDDPYKNMRILAGVENDINTGTNIDWPLLVSECIDFDCVKNNFKFSTTMMGEGWGLKLSDVSIQIIDDDFANLHSLEIHDIKSFTRPEMSGSGNFLEMYGSSISQSIPIPVITLKFNNYSVLEAWSKGINVEIKHN